jgi:hypothetical protein
LTEEDVRKEIEAEMIEAFSDEDVADQGPSTSKGKRPSKQSSMDQAAKKKKRGLIVLRFIFSLFD